MGRPRQQDKTAKLELIVSRWPARHYTFCCCLGNLSGKCVVRTQVLTDPPRQDQVLTDPHRQDPGPDGPRQGPSPDPPRQDPSPDGPPSSGPRS